MAKRSQHCRSRQASGGVVVERPRALDPLQFLRIVRRGPELCPPLDVELGVRAIAEHAREDQSGGHRHRSPVVAKLVDVLTGNAHGIGQRGLRQTNRLHEFLARISPTDAGFRFVINIANPPSTAVVV
jgi:hypothetical protein